ncbi:hypothetical protein AAFF_G00146240 [Aldrovandia affinis]|uniref:Uncharacterized protein n=1 Tax=Aldrovandia affinis TaxID=143900 RepID=A0AAD7RPP5_9TELE|nr:hypothetical protein AAFF_G00146240 [Aldrovandia affinis]
MWDTWQKSGTGRGGGSGDNSRSVGHARKGGQESNADDICRQQIDAGPLILSPVHDLNCKWAGAVAFQESAGGPERRSHSSPRAPPDPTAAACTVSPARSPSLGTHSGVIVRPAVEGRGRRDGGCTEVYCAPPTIVNP